MSENLKLPICPKCNDTKNVEELKIDRAVVFGNQYHCCFCNLSWWISITGNGRIVEGI